ncbi:class I SAM-dependent methyltransferase [Pseudotabrizicola alkalilacus]|uniref:Class I SAM-dependent methyltransferase n=1 Tax=Pseudotabrizicola alkalilacus TaxID=2305252 RepID=A0A411Z002_9RHOB|nr:class I SAM-dependent methyltransferase [Pseudotabrizicola alkalilacus]RGP36382.1 class I SAM-dependent methyltransferase [Pseudotabrizicola alkalilacus]
MTDGADRFDGLAEAYEMHRPGYPAVAFQALLADLRCPIRVAVDVGAGPGNSTASLRDALGAEWRYIAIEPGRDMRRVLSRRFSKAPDVHVAEATAEDMKLPGGFAALIVACTAFHWFDMPRFHAETARVLAPGGVLALIRNRRRPIPVIQAFDRYIETHSTETPDLARREARKEPVVRDLAQLPGFMTARSSTYHWSNNLTARGLIDLYLTRSTLWGVVRRIGLSRVMADLTAICAEHGLEHGAIEIAWETTAKWARKRSE